MQLGVTKGDWLRIHLLKLIKDMQIYAVCVHRSLVCTFDSEILSCLLFAVYLVVGVVFPFHHWKYVVGFQCLHDRLLLSGGFPCICRWTVFLNLFIMHIYFLFIVCEPFFIWLDNILFIMISCSSLYLCMIRSCQEGYLNLAMQNNSSLDL